VRTTRLLILAALTAFTASGCFKQGKGKGTRAPRPLSKPTITENDPVPGPVDDVTEMDPEARAILAACFKIDVAEVQPIVGWTDAAKAREGATALCATLAKTGYQDGISNTADPAEID
jgi:hypothetical protein